MDQHPSRGGINVLKLLPVTRCYKNWDRLRRYGTFLLDVDAYETPQNRLIKVLLNISASAQIPHADRTRCYYHIPDSRRSQPMGSDNSNKQIQFSIDAYVACISFHRPFKHIWHGSRENGEKYPSNCRRWLSSSSQDFSTASALNGREPALAERKFPCSSNLIVLCVQTNPTKRRRFRSSKFGF